MMYKYEKNFMHLKSILVLSNRRLYNDLHACHAYKKYKYE